MTQWVVFLAMDVVSIILGAHLWYGGNSYGAVLFGFGIGHCGIWIERIFGFVKEVKDG